MVEYGAGMSKLAFEATSGIAVLRLDNPPVNSLGHELRALLFDGLERAAADDGIEAVVVILVATIALCYFVELFVLPQTQPSFLETGRAFPAAPISANSARPRRRRSRICWPSFARSSRAASP